MNFSLSIFPPRARLTCAAALALAAGPAVAQSGAQPGASSAAPPSPASEPPAVAASEPPAPPVLLASPARAAVLPVRAGDRVRVAVWREPTFSGDYVVNERGDAVLPQLGPVHIEGILLGAVRDTLVTRYRVYLRNPSIDVVVLRRVGVQGEVRAPNSYYVDATESMREVVTRAGGPLETARRNHVALVRDGRTVAVTKLEDEGAQNIELRSGDQIVVARQSWVQLNLLAIIGSLGVVVPVGLSLLNFLKK